MRGFRRVRKIAKSDINFVMSVSLSVRSSAWSNSTLTERIFLNEI
jgi:hypothetical protein